MLEIMTAVYAAMAFKSSAEWPGCGLQPESLTGRDNSGLKGLQLHCCCMVKPMLHKALQFTEMLAFKVSASEGIKTR